MQDNPYDDQKTVVTNPQSSETPTLYYEKESVPQEAMQPKMIPLAAAQQKKKPPLKKIFLGGAIVLVLFILGGVGGMFLPKLFAGTNNQTAVASTPAANPAAKNIYAPYLTQYRTPIRSQIAQGLHLSADQLETQLGAGKTLSQIATAQGISASQLQTIVTSAIQSNFQPTVNSGDLTQKQVDALVKRMLKQPKTLERYLVVRAKNNAGAAPTAAAQ